MYQFLPLTFSLSPSYSCPSLYQSLPLSLTFSLFLFTGDPLQPTAPRIAAGVTSSSFTVLLPDRSSFPALHPVTSYQIEYILFDPFIMAKRVIVSAQEASYLITGLSPNTEYSVRLKARNDQGDSLWSLPTTVTTLAAGKYKLD